MNRFDNTPETFIHNERRLDEWQSGMNCYCILCGGNIGTRLTRKRLRRAGKEICKLAKELPLEQE